MELALEALEELGQEERRFLRAWCEDDRDTAALARSLGVAVTTVYTRRFKIVAKLARKVEELEKRARNPPN